MLNISQLTLKKLHVASAAALLIVASSSAFAETKSPYESDSNDRFYIKANIGSSIFDSADSDVGTVSSQSKVDSSFSISGGLVLNELLGFELSHNEFGSTNATIETGTGNIDLESSVSSNAISIVPRYPLGNKVDIYAELGQHIWEADIKEGGVSSTEDGSDVFYGFGFDYKVNDNIKAGFEFSRYLLDSDDFSNSSVSLTYQF